MKKSKKLLSSLLVLGVALSTFPISADLSINQIQQNKTYANELSKEEIVKKFYDNFSSTKSFNAKTETVITYNELEMTLKLDSPTIAGNPDVSMSGYANIPPVDGQPKLEGDISIVKKDDVTYVNIPSLTSGAWFKTTDAEMAKALLPLKGITEYLELRELFREYNSDISVTEKDGKYEISYTKADEKVYKIIETKLLNMGALAPSDMISSSDLIATKMDGHVTFLVNKENFNVESLDFLFTGKDSDTVTIKSSSKLSDINQVSEITLPEGAKYALNADNLAKMG